MKGTMAAEGIQEQDTVKIFGHNREEKNRKLRKILFLWSSEGRWNGMGCSTNGGEEKRNTYTFLVGNPEERDHV